MSTAITGTPSLAVVPATPAAPAGSSTGTNTGAFADLMKQVMAESKETPGKQAQDSKGNEAPTLPAKALAAVQAAPTLVLPVASPAVPAQAPGRELAAPAGDGAPFTAPTLTLAAVPTTVATDTEAHHLDESGADATAQLAVAPVDAAVAVAMSTAASLAAPSDQRITAAEPRTAPGRGEATTVKTDVLALGAAPAVASPAAATPHAAIASPQPATLAAEPSAPTAPITRDAAVAATPLPVARGPVAPTATPAPVSPAALQAMAPPVAAATALTAAQGPVLPGTTSTAQATDPRADQGPQATSAPVALASAQLAPAPVAPAAAPAPVAPAQPVPAGFAAQIAKPVFTLATTSAPGEHVMVLKVTPENLGPVTVQAHITATSVRIELFAPTDAGRDAIRQVMPELRRDIAASGIQTQLDLSSGNHPGAQQGDTGRNAFNQRALTPNLATPNGRQLVVDAPSTAPRPGLSGTDAVLDVMA